MSMSVCGRLERCWGWQSQYLPPSLPLDTGELADWQLARLAGQCQAVGSGRKRSSALLRHRVFQPSSPARRHCAALCTRCLNGSYTARSLRDLAGGEGSSSQFCEMMTRASRHDDAFHPKDPHDTLDALDITQRTYLCHQLEGTSHNLHDSAICWPLAGPGALRRFHGPGA